MRSIVFSALACIGVVGLLGCSDDEAATGGGGSGGSATGGSGGGVIDPYEAVPAEAFVADAATVCPATFKTTAPVAGKNEGFESAGQPRDFYLILPPASFEGPRPLMVGFNGTNETGESFATRTKLEVFAERGFIVVAPTSVGNGTVWPVWDAMHAPEDDDTMNKDLATFDTLTSCIAGHFAVDRNRVYISGHSAGGIMANYVLQRRSSLLAGGIVASGVFSLTKPTSPMPLEEMFTIVTWGGTKDEYKGGTSGVKVPSINFVEQASIASVYYDAEPEVTQMACTAPVGHAWLDALNGWFVDALLAHPKGLGKDGIVPALPDGTGATCTSDPFVDTSGLMVTCPTTSAVDGCAETCQFYADCAVENGTVGGILGPQFTELGFAGEMNEQCGGCITHCEGVSTSAPDASVLACMKAAQGSSVCGPGIDGALPVIDAVNVCCDGMGASSYCMDFCTTLAKNSSAIGFLPTCKALLGLP